MANPNQVVGQVKITIDGTTYSSSKEATLEIGGPSREAVAGDYEAGAFTESTNPAKLTVSLLYKKGVSLAALRAIDNATAVLTTDTGIQWIVRNAYTSDVISFGQDGKASLVMGGPPAEEVL
ncbi:phage tail tube protein [Novosphingobium clariflavum]|uniref:Phage tail tube protein n=1 Tax=Novosphingobium clariflavum TaxID=2029884 RepID=A0ABV6SCK1_9SPHN|nr:phage tail tube protein [Novosphingobium clariflavum]